MLGNQWFGIPGSFLQGGQGGVISDVSERDADIAQQSPAFSAENRGAGKTGFETGFVQV